MSFEFELNDILQRHPLGEGLVDAELNKAQVADALNTSEITVGKYQAQGMPFLAKPGDGSHSWVFSLAQCHAWVTEKRELEEKRRSESDRAAAQYRLIYMADNAQEDAGGSDMRAQREAYENSKMWLEVAYQQGQLVKVTDVQIFMTQLLTVIRDQVLAIPDDLEIKHGLGIEFIEPVSDTCHEILEAMVHKAQADGLIGPPDAEQIKASIAEPA